jgi:uncharacterized protein
MLLSVVDRLNECFQGYPDVRLVYLFGSLATNEAVPDSDADIAATISHLDIERRLQLLGELAQALARPVDLVDLDRVGAPLLGEILASHTRVLGSNSAHAEMILRHLYLEADFVPLRNRILDTRRRTWLEG